MGPDRQGRIRNQRACPTSTIDGKLHQDAGKGELLLLQWANVLPIVLDACADIVGGVKGSDMYCAGSGLGRMPHFARLADGLTGEKRPVTYALALFLILGSSAVLAQSPVTLQELDGVKVAARVVRAQVIRREGRDVPTRYESDIKLVMGPGNGLQQHVEATVHGPLGPRKGQTMSSSHKIELPGELRGRGGGQGLFVFENGTLTFMRTFKSGALIRKFEFTRGGSGLACAMTETFARENGTGAITMNAADGSGEITIVSWKPVSSTCKIVGK